MKNSKRLATRKTRSKIADNNQLCRRVKRPRTSTSNDEVQNLQLDTLRLFGRPVASDFDAGLPFLDYVPAGALQEPYEITDRIDLNALIPSDDVFIVRTAGDSMIEAGIFHDDWIVVKQTPIARTGRIVVAITEAGEATMKFWFPEKGRIRLEPANAKYHPIYVDRAEVKGVVVGVYRALDE